MPKRSSAPGARYPTGVPPARPPRSGHLYPARWAHGTGTEPPEHPVPDALSQCCGRFAAARQRLEVGRGPKRYGWYPAYLAPRPALSAPCALSRARRRTLCRWESLAPITRTLPCPREASLHDVPCQVPRGVAQDHSVRSCPARHLGLRMGLCIVRPSAGVEKPCHIWPHTFSGWPYATTVSCPWKRAK